MIAIGGNALIDKDKQGIPDQYEAAVQTVKRIVDLIQAGWNVVITHGSGPQVGYILRRSELAIRELAAVPMDYADADIQGAVGYMFQRALYNEFSKRRMDRHPIAVVTQVLVDSDDPTFSEPTKPIGPRLDEKTARERAAKQGWSIAGDSGGGWRRVVPSPVPRQILELEQIECLVRAGYVVIACGGGGIPVVRNEKGYLVGVEAVIDKDLASGLLATRLEADLFVISTDVEKVAVGFNTPDQRWLDNVTLAEARALYEADEFDAGSMGPKVLAMIEFIERGGKRGLITNPPHLVDAIAGTAGTSFIAG